MSFPRQLGRAILFFVGSVIAFFCIVSLLSFPSEKERSIRRRITLEEAAKIVEHRLSVEGSLPEEVILVGDPGKGELQEIRISVSPRDRHELSLPTNTFERRKPSKPNAFVLTYSWSSSDGVDTFDSATGKSSLDHYPSLLKRIIGACFFLPVSYLCFRTAKAAYQGESEPSP